MGRGFERVNQTYGQRWGEVWRGLNKHLDRDGERFERVKRTLYKKEK